MAINLQVTQTKAGRATPQMNVTPLVDVVLVLLIIFMMITPLLAKQFWLHLPDKDEKREAADPSDTPPIVVFVEASGAIKINREQVPAEEFSHKLTRVLAGSGQRTVFFDADDDAEFAKAVEVMDLARGSGATSVAVLTSKLPAN
jgi:biopolymer transport protein ExbD/biopolymer transport protein TolR